MPTLDQLQLLEAPDAHHRATRSTRSVYTSIEICAGAGGAALGIEQAGFTHAALLEIDHLSCETLRRNRPHWRVIEQDIRQFTGWPFIGVDLLSGGVPCPPFSKAGLQQGLDDERDLFPEALRLISVCKPRAVMLENVPGLMEARFTDYRTQITSRLEELGYKTQWKVFQASDFGVPQLRPRVVCIALQSDIAPYFSWPIPTLAQQVTVGQALHELMASAGWSGAAAWAAGACKVAPTLVGGSKKHGGPDLGPTRARTEWAKLGVNGLGIANEPPEPAFVGMPKLTVPMAAIIQGFPKDWVFAGKKTPAYRQIGNAFPPPVARAIATAIYQTLQKYDREQAAKQRKVRGGATARR